MTEKETEFLKRLTELTRELGVYVGGCGCCGSPWIYEIMSGESKKGEYSTDGENGYLMWNKKK
jgi:hypothetical protein